MAHPIILAHGLARFDILWSILLGIDQTRSTWLDRLHIFKGIRTMLIRRGFTVFNANLPWAKPIEHRAERLKRIIIHVLQVTGARKVHLIAHSMGGLDARHMMFNDRERDRIHEKIASLTTISTPHEGSPQADLILKRARRSLHLFGHAGRGPKVLEDLGTHACGVYNHRRDVMEFEAFCERKILFQTYAGRHAPPGISLFFRRSHRLIYGLEGENDGLVSVKSAKWRDRYFRKVLDATDHLNEIGWLGPIQALRERGAKKRLEEIHEFYAELARGLP